MLISEQFQMRVSPQDKDMLRYVAKHFQRSQADTVRTLVREVYQVIKSEKQEQRAKSQEGGAETHVTA